MCRFCLFKVYTFLDWICKSLIKKTIPNNEELKAIKRGAEIRDKLVAIDFSVKTISSSKLQDMSVSLDIQSTRLGAKVRLSMNKLTVSHSYIGTQQTVRRIYLSCGLGGNCAKLEIFFLTKNKKC